MFFSFRKWLTGQFGGTQCRQSSRRSLRRRLEAEQLEGRLAPAIITINTADDSNTRDTILTLREAMLVANGELPKANLTAQEKAQVDGDPTGASFDTIKFAIGNGAQTVSLRANLGPLPILDAGPVIIDGTPPGAFPNQTITIDGTNVAAGNNAHGLVLGATANGSASGSSVLGLTIQNFKRSGIQINNTSNNKIGGSQQAENNIIKLNNIGIEIKGTSAQGNSVVGNFLLDNKVIVANGGGWGVLIDGGARGNVIGKEAPVNKDGVIMTPANVISGNEAAGVAIINKNSTENVIIGNFIGLEADGETARPNKVQGVAIQNAFGNFIGGLRAGERNIISKNVGAGVEITGKTATGNFVQGNYIGTKRDGTGNLGNAKGVFFPGGENAASGNKVKKSKIKSNLADAVDDPDQKNQIFDPNSISGNGYGINHGGSLDLNQAKPPVLGGERP